MKCKNDLDERQLLQRGNVFQHGLVLFFVLVAVNAVLKDDGIVWAEGMWENLLIIWAVVMLCLGEFAVKEIYPMGGGMSVIYIVEGICGALMVILTAIQVARGAESLLTGPHTLSRAGAQLIEGALMVLLLLVFLGKKVYNRRREALEDEA